MDKCDIIFSDRIRFIDIDDSRSFGKGKVIIDGYLVVMNTAGISEAQINAHHVKLSEGEVCLIFPYSYIEKLNVKEKSFMKMVYFPSSQMLDDDIEDRSIYSEVKDSYIINSSCMQDAETILDIIAARSQQSDINQIRLLRHLSSALFCLIASGQVLNRRLNGLMSRAESLTRAFLMDVKKYVREQRDLNAYAIRQSVTPKHLTTTVKKITGVSAHEWIERFVILEAKRLLLQPQYTSAQVAGMLKFSSPASFNRLFKRSTGMTPNAFRTLK